MRDVMGIIYTTKDDMSLRELTVSRAVAALPVAGRYRMIDFMLSGMVNTGIRNVGVIMQKNYHSLMDHLGSGTEWDLHVRNEGLFILPPFMTRENVGTYEGILDALRSNMGYLRRSKQELAIVTHCHTAMSTTFDEMLKSHERSGADMTLMCTRVRPGDVEHTPTLTPRRVYLGLDSRGMVTDLEVGPLAPSYDHLYMDVMVLKRQLLIQLIDQAFAHSIHDMNRDLLQRYIRNGLLRVNAFRFKGYSRRIETINSYYRFNMDLLKSDVRAELFSANPVYTKVRDEVPAYYGPEARIVDSLVADGCLIEGRVENSVLFRGVRVARSAHIKNSILMQENDIREDVELENVILDKSVTIHRGGRLIAPPKYPIVIGKNTTI
ncbi:MAG: glucose-1-phosphate adenylyltransferase subunit GlgD [Clostridiales bacterium]|nr:glucose-1-phosphate adenylyltransferase subunit GlgD [Clostridiales bacterium]